jgi:hypothetical protein
MGVKVENMDTHLSRQCLRIHERDLAQQNQHDDTSHQNTVSLSGLPMGCPGIGQLPTCKA